MNAEISHTTTLWDIYDTKKRILDISHFNSALTVLTALFVLSWLCWVDWVDCVIQRFRDQDDCSLQNEAINEAITVLSVISCILLINVTVKQLPPSLCKLSSSGMSSFSSSTIILPIVAYICLPIFICINCMDSIGCVDCIDCMDWDNWSSEKVWLTYWQLESKRC